MTQANEHSTQDPAPERRNGPRSLWIVLGVLALLLAFQLPAILKPAARPLGPTVVKVYVSATPQPKKTQIVTLTAGRALREFEKKETRMAAYATTAVALNPRTPTATRTTRPTATASPTQFPTIEPVPTAEAGAAYYRLKTWTEADALNAIEEAGQIQPSGVLDEAQIRFYTQSLIYEATLRFPALRDNDELAGQQIELKFWDHTQSRYALVHDHSTELFRKQLEKELNQGRVDLANLRDWLDGKQSLLEEDITSFTVYEANNLFGNAEEALVVGLVSNPFNQAFFVIRGNRPNAYRIYSLLPEWVLDDSMVSQSPDFEIRDLNGNERGEVVIMWHASQWLCQTVPNVFEWNGDRFVDLVANHQSDPYRGRGDCPELTYVRQEDGTEAIISSYSYLSTCPDGGYQEQNIFSWNGRVFTLAEKKIVPVPDFNGECALEWALQSGPYNDQAVTKLESALRNWSRYTEEAWGTDSHDYFTLILGTWYLKRGEVAKGLSSFRTVRDRPASSVPSYPAEIARVYLDTVESGGYYIAGQAVERYIQQEEVFQRGFNTLLTYFIFDLNGYELALYLDHPQTIEEFTSWLKRNQISYNNLLQGDFDGDGTEDWLVFLKNEPGEEEKYWLYTFLRRENQIVPFNLYFPQDAGENEFQPLKWQSYRPQPEAPLVNVIRIGQDLISARIENKGDILRIVQDLDSSYIGSESLNVKNWYISELRAIPSMNEKTLVVNYEGASASYIWDAEAGRLVPTGFAPELLEQNVALAERALFIEEDPGRANRVLKTLLHGKIWEPDPDSTPWLRPYLLYLHALASELEGDVNAAVEAYVSLWREYPDNPYTLIARRRLERVQ